MNTKPINLVIISATSFLILSACSQTPAPAKPIEEIKPTETKSTLTITPSNNSEKPTANEISNTNQASTKSSTLNCPWENFTDPNKIGIKIQVQKCTNGPFFTIDSNSIIAYYDSTDKLERSADQRKIVELFEKQPSESMEEAIKSQFIDTLIDPGAKGKCVVKTTTQNERTVYTIQPSDEFALDLAHNKTTTTICGSYSIDSTESKFFVKPQSDNNKFVFERIGEEGALFKDLEFIKPVLELPIAKTPRKK